MIHVYNIIIIILLIQIIRELHTIGNNTKKIAMEILVPMYNMIKKQKENK